MSAAEGSRAPLVSVVMPLYNAESYVEESIRSVLGQTVVDLELLVVDDGSSDASRDVVRSIRDDRVRLIEADHGGEGAARNVGLDQAQGTFVVWQDADDVSLPQRFARQLAAMRDDVDFVHHDMVFVDETGVVTGYQRSSNFPEDRLAAFVLREGCPFSCATIMLRASAIGDFRHSEGFRIGVDVDFVRRFARGRRGAHVAEPLTLYRKHSLSALATLRKEEEFSQVERLISETDLVDLVPDAAGWGEDADAVALGFVALSLARREFVEQASAFFDRAAARGPGRTATVVIGAMAALAAGRPRTAVELLGPLDAASLPLVLRGNAEALLGDHQLAASSYRRALELDPTSMDALEGLRSVSEALFVWDLDSPGARLTGRGR